MPARHESGIGPGPRNRLRRFGRRKRPKLEARHAPQRTSVAFFGLLGGGRKRKETPDKCLLPEFRALFGVLFFLRFSRKAVYCWSLRSSWLAPARPDGRASWSH